MAYINGKKVLTTIKAEKGTAATITIGTVTTGEAGSEASVENVGTEQAAILNFIIPKGDKGNTGAQGVKGDTGKPGCSFEVVGTSLIITFN